MTARRRLDAEMVRRGLAGSRAEAQAAIRAGKVSVAGRGAVKSATMVSPDEPVTIAAAPRPFVSRGGEKLAAALDRFGVDPAGQCCLDAGASTGGFTDCLLKRGAARVVAVDVGYGQLAWTLREDPRVVPLERTNVRDLQPADLPFAPELVVVDLSFISLRMTLPALARVAATPATFVLLVKPQFEAGPEEVRKGGVVRDPAVWRRVLDGAEDSCRALGLEPRDVMASPILGPAGNVEFLLHAERASPSAPPSDRPDLDSAVAEGERLRSPVAS
jgi:23S rRNA (cytidine1920-2'-O)/16S rRNA (cytidine1409-2'-O)-methyltransferase